MPSGLGERKINRENRAFAGDGGNLNIAILSGQDFAGKIQTDADAAFILYLTGAVEALEYFRKFLLVYADAGIRDIDPCKQLIGVNGDSNAAGGGIFDGIVQKIADRFACPLQIKADRGMASQTVKESPLAVAAGMYCS